MGPARKFLPNPINNTRPRPAQPARNPAPSLTCVLRYPKPCVTVAPPTQQRRPLLVRGPRSLTNTTTNDSEQQPTNNNKDHDNCFGIGWLETLNWFKGCNCSGRAQPRIAESLNWFKVLDC